MSIDTEQVRIKFGNEVTKRRKGRTYRHLAGRRGVLNRSGARDGPWPDAWRTAADLWGARPCRLHPIFLYCVQLCV